MVKVGLIAVGILIFVAFVFFFLWRNCRRQKKELKEKLDFVLKQFYEVRDENIRFQLASKTVSKNRREADEKIDELHNGDSVANAIDGLCKHKDSDS